MWRSLIGLSMEEEVKFVPACAVRWSYWCVRGDVPVWIYRLGEGKTDIWAENEHRDKSQETEESEVFCWTMLRITGTSVMKSEVLFS